MSVPTESAAEDFLGMSPKLQAQSQKKVKTGQTKIVSQTSFCVQQEAFLVCKCGFFGAHCFLRAVAREAAPDQRLCRLLLSSD